STAPRPTDALGLAAEHIRSPCRLNVPIDSPAPLPRRAGRFMMPTRPRSSRARSHGGAAFMGAALLAAMAVAIVAPSAADDHDPARTATIYVPGFDLAGASRSGVYGDEMHEAVADSIAALAELPVSPGGEGPLPPNVVIGVGYYGD